MNTSQRNIAVVGQGVIGLTCAAKLLELGYSVDIYSRDEFKETTSMSAGAYWWPHKVYPEERVTTWSKETYNEYKKIREIPESGIHFEKHFRFCLDPDDSAYARHLLDEWEEIDGEEYGVPCKEAFLLVVPVIDVPVYMPYLRKSVESSGGRFHLRELKSPAELFPKYKLAVNCTGVWSRQFVGDENVFPIRGQTVRVALPDGLRESTRLYQRDDNFTLILPRSDDVILGGTAQGNDWNLEPSDEDTEIVFNRCSKLVPEISSSEILGTTVGLRPGRKVVRLELEMIAPGCPVVHNYGHGGGGYTVAWGCAKEVAQISESYFS